MPDLNRAAADLRTSLGDFLERERTEGVFHLQVGGPGSIPELAHLDVPELHLDILPEPITDQQVDSLRGLGYVQQSADTWLHPGGWRLVLPDHASGWRVRQQALRALLTSEAKSAQQYCEVFTRLGREAADEALWERALAHHAATVGFRPAQFAAQTLSTLRAPWMFAAGVALDLHLGRVARPHDDIDVVIPREAQQDVLQLLGGWRLDAPSDGAYHAWTEPLPPPHHQVHARHPDLPAVLMLDLLFTDLSGGVWHYRRDPSMTLPLEQARRLGSDGLPYLAPEAVLLFKASTAGGNPRSKDEQDFRRVLPTLDANAQTWLRDALARSHPDHHWIGQLE